MPKLKFERYAKVADCEGCGYTFDIEDLTEHEGEKYCKECLHECDRCEKPILTRGLCKTCRDAEDEGAMRRDIWLTCEEGAA